MNQLRKNKRGELHDYVRGEWTRTREARQGEIRDAAIKNYKLYHRSNDEVVKGERDRNYMNPGQKGSMLRAPLVFWGVETLLPRLVTVPPQFTVTGKTTESHKYARAKQARLNMYAKTSHFHQRLVQSTRQALIIGNSPVKVPFEPDRNQPEMQFIPWWDFFFSPEARTVRHADWIFHRTFYSEMGCEWLKGFRDGSGRKTFENMDDIPMSRRDTADDTYTERKDIDGTRDDQEIPVKCIIEGWSKYGHYVAMGGNDGEVLLSAKQSPYHDARGIPYRPFGWFGFHQDIDSPYGQGVGEIVGDHQVEVEVLRNGHMEQIRGNLYAPVIALDNIDADELEAALSVPNGMAFADSQRVQRVQDVAMRMSPGQASTDFERARDDIRTEVQMVLGISDSISGVQLPGGAQDNTATGATIRQQESNKRIQLLGIDLELELQHIATMFDAHDRQFGGEVYVRTADLGLSEGLTPAGMTVSDGMVKVGHDDVNDKNLAYQIEVSAGSLQREDEMHVHQAFQKFVANMSHPNMAPYINWREAATAYAQMTGHDELILEPQEIMDQQQMSQMIQATQNMGPASPLGNGPGAQQAEMGAGAPPTAPGPPAPPNVTGPTDR